MMNIYSISRKDWDLNLKHVLSEYEIYAPIKKEDFLDYNLITPENIENIRYNEALPFTPLKIFFFPIKENAVKRKAFKKERVIIGVPSCDLHALNLMDKIFLDEDFLDPYYQKNREHTILIGTDCYTTRESCHCVSYGINPFPEINMDISFSMFADIVVLKSYTEKGESFIQKIKSPQFIEGFDDFEHLNLKRNDVIKKLKQKNSLVPDREQSRKAVLETSDDFWKKQADPCVSCGACATICPTCHCFLLIDKEKFEKIKNWDTCQHPAFEKVAAGEDPLKSLADRLKNRYLCKFVHKPEMFNEIACTGCGRCIEACIAKINKNEVLIEANEGIRNGD